ncbi:MAG: hypothetical protein JJE09_11300 [Bacteroidia bacterium]|nr:hypothetical protein [Bacteroidia bacterium]
MEMPYLRSPRFLFIAILIFSLLLRWGLVIHGGQFFNPDEYLYQYSRIIAKDIQNGHYTDALTEGTNSAGHMGFKIIGVLPALVEEKFGENALIPAFFFSTFSLFNISIIWFLALKLGADEKEALWAVVLVSSSNALFYYSSHLFPYDIALTFGLATLYLAAQKYTGIWISVLTGILGFLTFFTYNGYWTLAAFAIIVHIFLPAKIHLRLLYKSILTTIGFAAPFIFIVLLSRRFGNDLLISYSTFSKTITNGLFSEGGSIPFKYLWSTEYSILIIWLSLTLFSFTTLMKARPDRIIIWLAGLIFIYGCLVVSSVVLHKFVVYGRLARQLVPFLALASGYSLRLIQERWRWGIIILTIFLAVVIVQTGINFRRPFQLIYPTDFANDVRKLYPDFDPPKNMTFFYTPNIIDVGNYKAYYVKYVFPLPERDVPIEGELLMSAENPLSSFPPFRFDEGFPPNVRTFFPVINMMVTRINE